jgi:hypothetical protein
MKGIKVLRTEDNPEGMDLGLVALAGGFLFSAGWFAYSFFKTEYTQEQLQEKIQYIKDAAILLVDGDIRNLKHANRLIAELKGDDVALGIVKKRKWLPWFKF